MRRPAVLVREGALEWVSGEQNETDSRRCTQICTLWRKCITSTRECELGGAVPRSIELSSAENDYEREHDIKQNPKRRLVTMDRGELGLRRALQGA